jgi:phenylalanine-4-hydroxylase
MTNSTMPQQPVARDADGYYQYDPTQQVMQQDYAAYTAENHQVWQILYERQMRQLPGKATAAYLNGVSQVGFQPDRIPNFAEVNKVLEAATGWRIYVVPGLIPAKQFFDLLRTRNFCATTWLRKMEELDYLEEPDMFHDVFGHVPLLTNQPLGDFVVELSTLAIQYADDFPEALTAIQRLYWYTIEFGLIREADGLRIYGAGILSSSGETDFSLYSPEPLRLPYDPVKIMQTPFVIDVFQNQYFVIENFDQLTDSMEEVRNYLKTFQV